jgi:hypothetical protein
MTNWRCLQRKHADCHIPVVPLGVTDQGTT